MTSAPSVRSRVEMLGRVDDDRLASYLRAANLYIGPATGGESFGIVLAEAMAAGLPIVASDIAGYRDVARNGVEAMLVPPGDPEALVAAVRRVLDDPQLARSLGERGAKRAHDFAWDTVTDGWCRCIGRYSELSGECWVLVLGAGCWCLVLDPAPAGSTQPEHPVITTQLAVIRWTIPMSRSVILFPCPLAVHPLRRRPSPSPRRGRDR